MAEKSLTININTGQAQEATEGLAASLGSLSASILRMGTIIGTFAGFNALVNQLTSAIQSAVQFEKQLADIRKVTDKGVARQMRVEIKNLAETIPIARDQLTSIVEEAGRLGIEGTENIKNFTKTVSQISVATNISADEASRSFARIIAVTDATVDEISNLGSSINALSNNMATSADEIVSGMLRSSAAASRFGLTAQEISAVSASINEVSATARRANTRTRRLFQGFQEPGKVEELQKVFKELGLNFRELSENSPTKALRTVVDIFRQGGEPAQKFMEIFGTAERQALAGLAQNFDALVKSIEMSNTAFKENTSLLREYAIQSNTTAAQQKILRNNIENTRTELGNNLLPTYSAVLNFTNRLAKGFADLAFNVNEVADSIRISAASINRDGQKMISSIESLNEVTKEKVELPYLESLGLDSPTIRSATANIAELKKILRNTLGLEVDISNILSQPKVEEIKNKFSATLEQAIGKNPDVARNFVEGFGKRLKGLKKDLENGISKANVIQQFNNFFKNWRTRIAQSQKKGLQDGVEEAFTQEDLAISKMRNRLLVTRLESQSEDLASRFEKRFDTLLSNINIGEIEEQKAIDKIERLRKEFREKGDLSDIADEKLNLDTGTQDQLPFSANQFLTEEEQLNRRIENIKNNKDKIVKNLDVTREQVERTLKKLKNSNKPLSQFQKNVRRASEGAANSFQNTFVKAMQGGFDTVEGALKSFGRSFVKELQRIVASNAARQLFGTKKTKGGGLKGTGFITKGISSAVSGIGSLFGSGGGGPTTGNPGGVGAGTTTPTFPNQPTTRIGDGMVTSDGEIVQFNRNDNILAFKENGPLMSGNNKSSQPQEVKQVEQNINVTTGVQQTVRAEIKRMMPQIQKAALEGVKESTKRGGSTSQTMGA